MPHREEDVPSMDALGGGNGMMDMNAPNMPQTPPMQQDSPMQDDMGGDEGFDGMDDESEDEMNPKKSLQKLAGKLSQELRTYNNEQEHPDEDLNKYIAGMVIPQATKAMTDDGKKEVINKIKKGITDEEIDEFDAESEDDSDDGNIPSDDNMQMESRIYEIINNILDDTTKKYSQKVSNKTLPKKSPFRSSR